MWARVPYELFGAVDEYQGMFHFLFAFSLFFNFKISDGFYRHPFVTISSSLPIPNPVSSFVLLLAFLYLNVALLKKRETNEAIVIDNLSTV